MTSKKYLAVSTMFAAALGLALAIGPTPAFADSITLQNATATHSQQAEFDVSTAIDGVIAAPGVLTGWAIFPNTVDQTAKFETAPGTTTGTGTLTFALFQNFGGGHNIGRFRLSATNDPRGSFVNWVVLDPDAISAVSATLTEQADN